MVVWEYLSLYKPSSKPIPDILNLILVKRNFRQLRRALLFLIFGFVWAGCICVCILLFDQEETPLIEKAEKLVSRHVPIYILA